MSNVNTNAKTDNVKLEETEAHELTSAELDNVSGGGKKASSGTNAPKTFLKFEMTEALLTS